MTAIRRVLGAYAILLAIAVGLHFIVTPLYDDGSTGFPVWNVFNWFMAVGVLLALIAGLIRKLRPGGAGAEGSDLKRYAETNAVFYASVILVLWFFWRWFSDTMGRESSLSWAFINPLFVVTVGAVGFRLWREADDGE